MKLKKEAELAQKEKEKIEAENKRLEAELERRKKETAQIAATPVSAPIVKKREEPAPPPAPAAPISLQEDTEEFGKIFSKQKQKTKQITQKLKELEDNAALQNAEDIHLVSKIKPNRAKKLVQLDKLKFHGKTKEEYEKEAIAQINKATLAGIRSGETASRRLHADAKVQSEGQTAEAVGKLKDKFDATKSQVLAIVNNFGKIRSDLQELKNEYIQE